MTREIALRLLAQYLGNMRTLRPEALGLEPLEAAAFDKALDTLVMLRNRAARRAAK